jgi:hypothetical protein
VEGWVTVGFDSSDLSVTALLMDRQGALWVVTGGHRRELIRIADRAVQEELEGPQIPVSHKVRPIRKAESGWGS